MKKFKIIRNILIISILIVAVVYICWMRPNDIHTSKTYKLFDSFMYIQNTENKQVAMEIAFETDNIKFSMISATDFKNEKEVCVMDCYHKNIVDRYKMKSVTTITEEGTSMLLLYPDLKKYRDYGIVEAESTNSYDIWIYKYLDQINQSNYYTRGYEFVNGKLLYYEKFKNSGLKFYYDKNELVYMKNKKNDDAFDDVKDTLYTVKIMYNDEYKKFMEIPEDYTEMIPEDRPEEIEE